MALQTGIIETQIVASVDKKSFGDGINFARDTGVKIDQALKSELTLNTIEFQSKIKNIKQQLKQDIPAKKRLELEIDLGDTKSELTEAKRRLNNLKNTGDAATSRLQAKFNATNAVIAKSNTIIGRLKTGFKNLGVAAAGFFAIDKFKSLVSGAFNLASQVQSASAAFESLTGSVEKTNKLLKEIDEFAARTPFNKLKIIDSTKQLLGFGFAADEIIPTLEGVGNAVAAVGGTDETLSGVISALGQIQAKGKLSTEEVLQIAERGLPIFEVLKKELGLTAEQLGNIGNQGITAAEAIPAILRGFQEKFAGSLEAQSATLQGQLSNLLDAAQLLLSKIGLALLPVFIGLLSAGAGLIGFLDKFGKSIAQAIVVVGAASIGFGIYTGAIALATIGTTAFAAAVAFFSGPIGIAIAAIVGLTAVFSAFNVSADSNIAAMAQASNAAAILAGNIDRLKLSIDDLNKAYEEGKLNAVEYAKEKKKLTSEIDATTRALEREVELSRLVNAEYIAAGEALEPLNAKLDLLNKRYTDGERSLAILNSRHEEGSFFVKQAEERQKALGEEINSVTAEIDKLIAVENIQITTQQDVNAALDSISGAKSLAVFNQLKQAAISKIQNDIDLINSELAVQEVLGGFTISPQRFAANQAGFLKTLELAKSIRDIEGRGFVAAPGDPGPKGPGGSGGKSQATKDAEKEAADILKIKEDQAKEAEKIAKEEATITEEAFKDAFDAIGDRIKDKEKDVKDFTKEIEKSIDKIADIDAKIGELGASASEDLASRFVEVEEEIADPETDSARLEALQAERDLILANTTEEERAEAIRKEGLSDTEKILEKRDLEIAALEEKKVAEQLALDTATAGRDAALLQIEEIRATEQRLSEAAIAQTGKEFLEKAKSAQAYSDLLDSLFGDTVSGGSGPAGGVPVTGGGTTGGTTIINEETNLELNVEGVIDEALIDTILDKAALKIQDARVTRANQ